MTDSFADELKRVGKTSEELVAEKHTNEEKKFAESIVDVNDLIPLFKKRMIEEASKGRTVQTNNGKRIEYSICTGKIFASYNFDRKLPSNVDRFSYEQGLPGGSDNYGAFFNVEGERLFDVRDKVNNLVAMCLDYKDFRDVYYAIGMLNHEKRFNFDFSFQKGLLRTPSFKLQVKMNRAEKRIFDSFKETLKKAGIECDYVLTVTYSSYLKPYSVDYSYSELNTGIIMSHIIYDDDYYGNHRCSFNCEVHYILHKDF